LGSRSLQFFPLALSVILFFGAAISPNATIAQTTAQTIPAYKAQYPVSLDGMVQPGEWNDTPTISISIAGIAAAFKQNGTGLLFLLEWNASSIFCYDQACFGGVEFGNVNNTGAMGTGTTPTIMLLLSQSFKGGYDEFISTAESTPSPVEASGYATQSTCGFTVSNGVYTAECYRPFHLARASPSDPFYSLAAGSPIELGFALGEFSQPGLHEATDMSTYLLSLSNQTYSPPPVTSVSTSSPQSVTTTTHPITPATPFSLYAFVKQWGPYLPLAAIIIAAIHFVRRRGWTGKSPW